MKSFPLRRVLASVVLLAVLGIGVAAWLLGSAYGRRVVASKVREGLTHNSELVLAPFTVELSPWRDFPHLTASVRHLVLTDTSYQKHIPVLRIARADLRVELLSLLRSRIDVRRLEVTDVDFQERVDSLGRAWGLRGKRRKGTGNAPTLNLKLDELVVNNFQFSSHNAYSRGAFGVRVRQARLAARLQGGVLRVSGTLEGDLSYLRTRAGTLFEREPVTAWVNYKYTFENRQGQFYHTRATLNGDTIRVSGTHTVDPKQPAGTMMALRFVGNQPLVDVLHAALPPRLDPYLAGATSPSKAHIHYTITGLSGPKISPRNVLTFGLRGASLQWPDPARRINRWDLRGTYDNGPAHNIRSTVLTLRHCRIYSSVGQLDVALTLRDFKRPFLDGRLRGRTALPQLAAVVSPGRWQARGGIADIDVQLRGLLPPRANFLQPIGLPTKSLSLRGTVTLRDASFVLPVRGADLSGLNVRLGLQDSLWQLSNASGVLNEMRFRASATTIYLLDYLTGQHATASISGQFAVDELRVAHGFSSSKSGSRTRNATASNATSASHTMVASFLLISTRSRLFRRLSRYILRVTSSARSSAASTLPNWAIRSIAPLSPIPGAPGMLSTASPFNASKSATCAGGTPMNSFTFAGSYQVSSLAGLSMETCSFTSCSMSLSLDTITTSKPAASPFRLRVPMTSSAS